MRYANRAFGVLWLAIVVGCTSQQEQQSVERETSHLRWLIRLCVLAGQQGKVLKSEQELKQYIRGMPSESLARVLAGAEVGSADELFISERDGLPYVVFYGTPPLGVAKGVIAFEQQGVDGERYVGYSVGIIEEVAEDRFATLVPPSARNPK